MEITTNAKKTLVVGASGFVGGHLVNELKKANHNVIEANFPNFNLLDKNLVEQIIKKERPNKIINLAAISSVSQSWNNPIETINVNVNGTINLLDAIQKYTPESKVLLIGSAEQYAQKNIPLKETDELSATNPYGISKIAQENFANLYRKKFGMNIISTRSFNHTGIGQSTIFALPSFIKQIASIELTKKEGTVKVGNLNAIRDFSDVRDVVHAYRMLIDNETEFNIYNVGSGIPYKIEELLNTIISFSTVKINVEKDVNIMRPIEMPYQCCDNSRIKKLGFWMATDIKETLKWMYKHELNPKNCD